jgi:hypothetical protein
MATLRWTVEKNSREHEKRSRSALRKTLQAFAASNEVASASDLQRKIETIAMMTTLATTTRAIKKTISTHEQTRFPQSPEIPDLLGIVSDSPLD